MGTRKAVLGSDEKGREWNTDTGYLKSITSVDQLKNHMQSTNSFEDQQLDIHTGSSDQEDILNTVRSNQKTNLPPVKISARQSTSNKTKANQLENNPVLP